MCDGASSQCPSDQLQPQGTVCRAASGSCDVAEQCDGVSVAFPADQVLANGVPCRSSAGACDVEEVCNGASGECPPDAVQPFGSVCGAVAPVGSCATTPVCTGSSATCPASGLKPVGSLCDDNNVCTAPDTCAADGTCRGPSSGVGGACQCVVDSDCESASRTCATASCNAGTCEYAPLTAGVECRAARAGGCDVAEQCDGVSLSCPVDVVQPAGVVCRASAGQCGGDVCEVDATNVAYNFKVYVEMDRVKDRLCFELSVWH